MIVLPFETRARSEAHRNGLVIRYRGISELRLSKFDHVGMRVEVSDRVGPEIAHEYERIFTVTARQSIAGPPTEVASDALRVLISLVRLAAV